MPQAPMPPALRSHLRSLLVAVAAATFASACAPGGGELREEAEAERGAATDAEGLSSGVNGGACTKSPYNCKLRVSGGNRVQTNAGSELWGVGDGPVIDGHGDLMAQSSWDHLRFNFGQTRHINGRTYGFAMATANRSGGWFPLDAVLGEDSLRAKMGEVNARAEGLAEMGCYEVRASHDETLAAKKVVFDTESDNERAGDYLALPRKNGARYANLTFNTPGFGLGGVAIDIFPSGTRFQRVEVPTDSGRPSIDVPLWVKDGAGRYRTRSGALKFIYGVVVTGDGTRRNGWMAYDALKVSSGCE